MIEKLSIRPLNCARALGMLTACVVAIVTAQSVFAEEKGDKKEINKEATEKVAVDSGVSQAALAAQLALAGTQRKSPILMLAAAEIVGGLKEGKSKSEPVKEAPKGAKKTDKKAISLDFRQLTDKAAEYAKGDEKLSALVEARVEQLSTRGLVYSQGAGKRSVNVDGVTFKVLDADVIGQGDAVRYTDVRFEGRNPAGILVVGDGDGDLDLWVYDGNSGRLIDSDEDSSSKCVVGWRPRYTGPFTIRIKNVGRIAERYVLLANW